MGPVCLSGRRARVLRTVSVIFAALTGSPAMAADPFNLFPSDCGSAIHWPACPTLTASDRRLLLGENTNFLVDNTLDLRGGTVRLSANTALTIPVLNATIQYGEFDNAYTQVGVTALHFNGNTAITGGPSGTNPSVDFLRLRASAFDTHGMQVFNNGTMVISGFGYVQTSGPVQFNNLGTFQIDNDYGFYAGNFQPNFIPFVNAGFLRKTGGSSDSIIPVRFDQNGGTVEAVVGSIVFNGGGVHHDARFFASPGGANPTGQIVLGGAHTFSGTSTTHPGGIIGLASPFGGPTPTLDVVGNWDQRGTFSNSGDIRIAESGILLNSGFFLPSSGSSVSGTAGLVGGIIVNSSTGVFSSDIFETPSGGRLDVSNHGVFTVAAGQTAELRNFVNHAGIVTVNGYVTNIGSTGPLNTYIPGTFQLLGGELQGSGFINTERFEVGGVGVAKFRPGLSPGTMTINGPFFLLPGGVIELEVERDPLTGAILADQVIADSFSLNGQVSFLIGAGVELADLAGLQFLQCNFGCNIEYGTEFSYLFPGRAGSTLAFDANGLTITSLAPVPESETWAMLLAGLGVIGTLVWRRRQAPLAA